MSDNKKDTLKGELLAHGADNYLHDPNKSMNYYAQIKKDDGTISERWGKDLEGVIKESGVQVGDTVVLAELGKEPVVVGDKTFNKTIWDLQRYEPVLDLPNVIEHDTEREQEKTGVLDKTKENEHDDPSTPNQAKKVPDLSEFDFELPDNIKNNYFGIVKNRYLLDQKTNYYDKDDKNQVNIAFEDRNKSLHTSRQDEKTIYAMLDMAQAKNWTAIKLKGTDEFKQKAWLEASLRGIEVKGYEPNEKDLAELKARQAERTTNEVGMTAQKAPEPKQETEAEKEQSKPQQTPPTHTPTGQETIYGQLQKPMDNQAYLDRIGLNFGGTNVDRYAKNSDEVVEKAQDFVGKELTNIHSGIKGVISNSNIKKMISGSASDKSVNAEIHRVASANADKLFENSVFAWQYQDRNNDSNFIAIHRAIAPLKFNDEIYFAKLTVKELARERGNKIYSIEAVEVEQGKSPIPDMMSVDQDKQGFTEHRPNGALIDIIVKNAQEYNRENQKNVDDLQDYNKDQLQDEPQQTPPTQEQDNQGVNFDFLNENALNEPQQPPASAMSDRDYTDEEMALYEQQQLAKWEAERLSLYEQNEHTYTDEDMERYEQQVYDQWENNQLAEQTPPTQAEPLDIGVQTQEQSHVQNDRFTFEAMTAEDVGISESEYLRQATHITDRETGEHYIIGNYDFEHDGNVHNGVIAEYYTDEQALAERDDNALIGGERIFSKLGIHDKGLVNHIEGDSRLTAEQLDKAVSLETLKNTVSNQPIMPNKEFELVSESVKQAEFDSRELALAQTAMLRNYDVSWDRLDQHEKYERLASSVGEYKIDEQKYNQFIDNLQRNINQDLSYLKYETKEINQELTPQKSAADIKKDIRQIFQTGYKDGSIKSRDELVEVLKERGFEVKENDKSIRVSLPNSDQAVNLKGEVFTKGYDAIKSLKERLEPETLKQTYPTLTDSDIVHVTAYKNKLFDGNRDMQTPKALQASLVRLEDSVKDMAKGKDVNLPDLPVNEIKPDIEVRTTDNHDKSRQV